MPYHGINRLWRGVRGYNVTVDCVDMNYTITACPKGELSKIIFLTSVYLFPVLSRGREHTTPFQACHVDGVILSSSPAGSQQYFYWNGLFVRASRRLPRRGRFRFVPWSALRFESQYESFLRTSRISPQSSPPSFV